MILPSCADLDALIENETLAEPPLTEADAQEESDPETVGEADTIATAMALLVIENAHLREVIQHLRDTISGLTDHRLL